MLEPLPSRSLRGRRILVVEDDYILAEGLKAELEAQGAEVLGPAPDLESARAVLAVNPVPHAALLDINLAGQMVYPLAETLQGRGVRTAFLTGYDAWTVPRAFAHVPVLDKTLDLRQVVRWLLE